MSLLLDALKEAAKDRKKAEKVVEPASSEEDRLTLDLDPEPQPNLEFEPESQNSNVDSSVATDSDSVGNAQGTKASAGSSVEEATQEFDVAQSDAVTDKVSIELTALTEGSFSNQSRHTAGHQDRSMHLPDKQGAGQAANVFQNRARPSLIVKYGIPIALVLLVFIGVIGAVLYLNGDWSDDSTPLAHLPGELEEGALNQDFKASMGVANTELVSTNLKSAQQPEDSALPGSSMHQTAKSSSINVSSSNGSSEIEAVDHRAIDVKIGGSTGALPSSIKPQVASQTDGQTATQEDFRSASFGNKTDPDRLGYGAEPTAAGIKIHKKPMLDPALRERHVIERALQRGDLEAAEEAYRRVLKLKSDDVDAMIGLANIFFNRGLIKQAQNAYFAILNKNPENLFAKVGLINIGVMDPANLAGGSELKQLIIEHPDQHFLHASLGSFYVRRNNWPAAQAAYFEALALDTENPDYAFNLAVSLDQLNKPDIAARYYRSALELIGKQAAGFSESDIRRRLQQLSGDLP